MEKSQIIRAILLNVWGYPCVQDEVQIRQFQSSRAQELFSTLVSLDDESIETTEEALTKADKKYVLECFDIWLAAADEDDSESVIETSLSEIGKIYEYLKRRWAENHSAMNPAQV